MHSNTERLLTVQCLWSGVFWAFFNKFWHHRKKNLDSKMGLTKNHPPQWIHALYKWNILNPMKWLKSTMSILLKLKKKSKGVQKFVKMGRVKRRHQNWFAHVREKSFKKPSAYGSGINVNIPGKILQDWMDKTGGPFCFVRIKCLQVQIMVYFCDLLLFMSKKLSRKAIFTLTSGNYLLKLNKQLFKHFLCHPWKIFFQKMSRHLFFSLPSLPFPPGWDWARSIAPRWPKLNVKQ